MSVDVVTKEMTERFQREVRRCSYPAKRLSREIGAHENTIGNYLRDHVPYQWVYLQQMHKRVWIFITFCLVQTLIIRV